MPIGHYLIFYQRQTNGHDLVSYQCQQGLAKNRLMPNQWALSQLVCFNPNQFLSRSNQIGDSLSTNVFEVYILQVKVDKRTYNSYVVIYIT